MGDNEEIHNQQKLLKTYRQTLAIYLEQQAKLGTAYMPPSIVHGIIEARDSIQRIKRTLRSWNISIDDFPDDIDKVYTDAAQSKDTLTQKISSPHTNKTNSINPEGVNHTVIVSSSRANLISEVIIKLVNGSNRTVEVTALEFGFFTGYGMTWIGALPLSSGVTVAFDKMKSVEILDSIDIEGEYSYTKDIRIRITLNSSRVLEDEIIKSRPHIQGSTDMGLFSISLADVKHVTFG